MSMFLGLSLAVQFSIIAVPVHGESAAMKGPPGAVRRSDAAYVCPETSVPKLAALDAVRFYQGKISTISGPRCGFYPSCSVFGHQALHDHGFFLGVMLTSDRLTRCNIFKKPGSDYLLLPSGRLFDPVSGNLLSNQ